MTLFLPLEESSSFPQSPSFLTSCADPKAQLAKIVRAVMKAKRVVVVCGAGISVQAGIPDFRSPEGLFQSLKRDNPRESLASGKDLFDVSVFNSEHTTSLFCQMIAQLSTLSRAASPTPFHRILRSLDDRGKLLRVYTQNIDAIESKSGLSFGVPEFDSRRSKPKSKGKAIATDVEAPTSAALLSPHRLPSPPLETPRCIPLHGTIEMLHCQTCTHSVPLQHHLSALSSGTPPQCPECTAMEETRQLVGKRARGVGKLRPSVVLYNEQHKDGEGVGEVVRKDLVGGSSKGKGGSRSGPDLLLVVGTSLRVPGTKRIVREFAKAVHSRSSAKETPISSGLHTPLPSPRRTPPSEEDPPITSVYLNLDFPVPTREWEGVFDVWLQGDAQRFAAVLGEEIDRETRAKEAAVEKKQRRDEEALMEQAREMEATRKSSSAKKRKADPPGSAPKRRKLTPPTPKTTTSKPKARKHIPSPQATKLYIRIPPRPPKHLVPEVYIKSLPVASMQTPKSSRVHTFAASTTPLPRSYSRKMPGSTAKRRSAGDENLDMSSDSSDSDSDDMLPSFHREMSPPQPSPELTEKALRRIQCGLRGG
ncbi:hypothetical protein PLICRDRAFT_40023 [Plicaturopsis crispa FD-325 SS-3]|nr:hypothetical protein PLICRDRAFT_40023 [Plicaturopsis crispa FD-325 SS-3]